MLMEVSTLMLRAQFLPAGIASMFSFILPLHSQGGATWKNPSPPSDEILYVTLFVWEG